MTSQDTPRTVTDDASAERLRGMGLVITSSIMISFGGLLSRYIEQADAWQQTLYRSGTIGLVVCVILLMRHRGNVLHHVKRIGWPGLIGVGILTIAGVSFMQAINTTTVADTLFTLSTIPFITALFAWIFIGERISAVTAFTMIGAGVGILVMFGGGLGEGSLYGNLMALITAIGFSGFAIIVRRYRHIDMLPILLVNGITLVLLSFLVKGGDVVISGWDLLMCFLWGGVLSGIGNALFIAAAKRLLAAEVTLFMMIEFALGPLWVWIFVNETPTQWTLIGGSLIIMAVTIRSIIEMRTSTRRYKRGRPAAPP